MTLRTGQSSATGILPATPPACLCPQTGSPPTSAPAIRVARLSMRPALHLQWHSEICISTPVRGALPVKAPYKLVESIRNNVTVMASRRISRNDHLRRPTIARGTRIGNCASRTRSPSPRRPSQLADCEIRLAGSATASPKPMRAPHPPAADPTSG